MQETYFIYNGKSSIALGLRVESISTAPIPARKYDYVTVPGRNGQVIIDRECFEDVRINVSCNMMNGVIDREQLGMLFDGSQGTLILSDDPTRYYEVMAIEMPTIYRLRPFGRNYDSVSLTFVCNPMRRWIQPTDRTCTVSGTSYSYAGTMPGKPKITITPVSTDSAAVGTVTINDTLIDIDAFDKPIVVDCEVMECYFPTDDNSSANGIISMEEYPVLTKGSFEVEFDGNVASVEILFREVDL